MSYLPLEHSVLQLSTSRDYGLESDNPQSASFTKGTSTTVSWMHDWSSFVSSNFTYTHTADDIQNAAGHTTKTRKLNEFGASVDWKMRRYVTLSFSFKNTDRDENVKSVGESDGSYKRNVYMLSADLAL